MADYPFTQNFSQVRSYYGPALGRAKEETPWLDEEQTPFYQDQSRLGTAAVAAGGIFASGFIPFGKGNLWNQYTRAIRAVEEYSPSQILRTFQFSNIASQFSKQDNIFISPDLLSQNPYQSDYLLKLIGDSSKFSDIRNRGVELRGNTLFFGQGTTDVALKYASAINVVDESANHLGSAYSRHIGAMYKPETMERHSFWGKVQPFGPDSTSQLINPFVKNATGEKFPVMIVGGQTRRQAASRMAGALGTEAVSRFNRLLKSPLEMEPLKSVFGVLQSGLEKFTSKHLLTPLNIDFAVKEGSGMQMLGRLTKKYGLGLGALTLGYQTADWAVRSSSLLDNTFLSEGITAGIATVGVKANMAISKLAEVTGLHAYREKQEEIAPGSTSLQKLIAFPLIGMAGAGFSIYGARLYQQVKMQRAEGISASEATRRVTELMGSFKDKGLSGTIGRALATTDGWYSNQGWRGKVIRSLAKPDIDGSLIYKGLGKMGPAKLFTSLGGIAGLALITPFIPGALLPSNRPDELEAIYSGAKEVEVRKGRWWEFGKSPFEGEKISYYRPHWYPRMLQRSKDKSIWGEDEPSPISKWFQKEFTYNLEEKFYKDRPYPITSLPFEDIPFVGPILANTIGRLIKPPTLMHTEEWQSQPFNREQAEINYMQRYGDLPDLQTRKEWEAKEGTGIRYKAMPAKFDTRVATEIGEKQAGQPITPYGVKGTIGEQTYRMTEMMGLPGFLATSIKEKITGSSDLYDQVPQLESARRIAGFERDYWDLELGGILGASEGFRRLYPHKRNQIPLYNPIANTMPEWLPGPGDKSPDFRHGDPFTKVPEGEIRLPGAGYAARYEELKGVDPKDYPLIHRWKILADIAPYSKSYGEHMEMVRNARKSSSWSESEEAIYQSTIEQIKNKKQKLEFRKYQYLSSTGEIFGGDQNKWGNRESSDVLASLNRIAASQKEGDRGVLSSLIGGYWELMSHNAETAFDQLTPMSPGAKLVHERTAIESYERTQLYGTQNAFWQNPIKDFIAPFGRSVMQSLGDTDVPGSVQDKRSIEETFDILKYMKATRLANLARSSNDAAAIKEFETDKDQTLFGINPFTQNYTSIYRALPRRDRDYFKDFVDAETPQERERILAMVPENEKALYQSRWKLGLLTDISKAVNSGQLPEDQLREAKQIQEVIYDEARTEGFPFNKDLQEEYNSTQYEGESYGEWYRRSKALPEKNLPLPGPDWVGWCLPSYQKVLLLDEGETKVENITEGKQILTHLGNGIIEKIHTREVDENIYKVMVSGDSINSMEATKGHKILAVQGEKCHYNLKPSSLCTKKDSMWKCNFCTSQHFKDYHASWIDIDKLDEQSFLLTPLLKASKENLVIDIGTLPIWDSSRFKITEKSIRPHTGIIKPLTREITIDESVAWILGYYLAEGNVWKTGERFRGIQFTAHIKEVPILELAKKIIFEKFGLVGRIHTRHRKTGDSAYLVVASGALAELFQYWIGRYCDKKFPPIWLEQITRKSQIALLDGLCTGDASKDGRDRLILTNYQLCMMAKQIWEACGIPSSIHALSPRDNRKPTFSVSPLSRYTDVIYFEDYIGHRITEIKQILYKGTVYDLSIANDRSYRAEIGIYHNCPSVDLEDVKLKVVQQLGSDMHDYDLWEERARTMGNKPYLDEAAEDILNPEELTVSEKRSRINSLLATNRMNGSVFIRNSNKSKTEINIEEDRDYRGAIKRAFS